MQTQSIPAIATAEEIDLWRRLYHDAFIRAPLPRQS
jgi:hypothetical protein